jgi:hypothetical protein
VNNRRLDQTVNKYVAGILEHGVLEEMRGTIIMVEAGHGDPLQFEVVGGGTLVESCYVAHQMEPDNANITRLISEGLHNCMVLTAGCPDDTLAWVKRVHNKFHFGQADTLAEMRPHQPSQLVGGPASQLPSYSLAS